MHLNQIIDTSYDNGEELKKWGVYVCKNCGGAMLAVVYPPDTQISEYYPGVELPDEDLPDDVRYYLGQAIQGLSTPSGSIVMSASAVDAMLKEKNYNQGSLHNRIEEAIKAHVLTDEMGKWAHKVRLDANSQRHADGSASFPSLSDAKRTLEFAKTLGEFLFVLPAKVTRGIVGTAPKTQTKQKQRSGKPRALKLPSAYRSGSYTAPIILNSSETQPVAKARFLNYQKTGLLSSNLQPPDLIVTNRPGNPKGWQTDLIIPECIQLPEILYVEIVVNGHVQQAGELYVNRNPK